MTGGFYEQIGVEPQASAGQIRLAYTRAVANIVDRRKATVGQGGDAASLDSVRDALDTAWRVLSDPVKRRRYDAMLEWKSQPREASAEALWALASDSLVHPAVSLAVKLLRVTTNLEEIKETRLSPSSSEGEPTLVPHDEDLTVPRVPRTVKQLREESEPASSPGAVVVDLPNKPVFAQEHGLRIVDGAPGSSDVIVLTPDPAQSRHISSEDIARQVDELGYSGAMLRAVREARGVSLQELADTTRISVRYLEAIEADRFEVLPSSTFVRGYVREMARQLKLDESAVVDGYLGRVPD